MKSEIGLEARSARSPTVSSAFPRPGRGGRPWAPRPPPGRNQIQMSMSASGRERTLAPRPKADVAGRQTA